MKEKDDEIRNYVKEHYSKLARGNNSCCGDMPACCADTRTNYTKIIGYRDEELKELPDTVLNTMAGCGNPTALAELEAGETVLDLGSGGGIDAFLAVKKVGSSGKVIGVDMTEDMIKLANKNKKKLKAENVEFRLGEIESLPVEDDSVDVIVSNCVINLSPDKDKVFKEAFRALKPGGRILISDIVTKGELPSKIRRDLEKWASCVGGALEKGEYLQKIHNAGFKDVEVVSRQDFMGLASSIKVKAYKPSS